MNEVEPSFINQSINPPYNKISALHIAIIKKLQKYVSGTLSSYF